MSTTARVSDLKLREKRRGAVVLRGQFARELRHHPGRRPGWADRYAEWQRVPTQGWRVRPAAKKCLRSEARTVRSSRRSSPYSRNCAMYFSHPACGPPMFRSRPTRPRGVTSKHVERLATKKFPSRTRPPSVRPNASAHRSYGKGRRGALATARPCPRVPWAPPGQAATRRTLGLDHTR